MGLTVARTLVSWRNAQKAEYPLLGKFTFSYDPAVNVMDLWPRSTFSVRISPAPLASYAVVPWEATEVVQIVADAQTAEAFSDTIHSLVKAMLGRVYITDDCRIWQCLLAGEPELAMLGSAREAVLTWHGTASWELT